MEKFDGPKIIGKDGIGDIIKMLAGSYDISEEMARIKASDFDFIFRGEGFIVGAYLDGKMIAYSAVDLLGNATMGHTWVSSVNSVLPVLKDAFNPQKDLLKKVDAGFFFADNVHSAHRGYGLQRLMIDYRLTLAKEHGKTFVMASVDSENNVSIDNYVNAGFGLGIYGRIGEAINSASPIIFYRRI